jgi:hypothetical protein
MNMPMLHGSCPHRDFFIYTACDHCYFENFGKTFIQSVSENSEHPTHIHLYNPTDQQIEYCSNIENLSYSYEYVDSDMFKAAAAKLEANKDTVQYRRSVNAMQKSEDAALTERIQKTYYACARFVRLWEIIAPGAQLLAADSDAVVRHNVPLLADKDFYIHHVPGKNSRYLAGGIMFSGQAAGYQFLSEYAQVLMKCINDDHMYWSLDQDVLDAVVPKYQWGALPKSYIDWDMQSGSYIWTAKGQRKNNAAFVNEQQKYAV